MSDNGSPTAEGAGESTFTGVDEAAAAEIGWWRAILSGLAVLVVGFAAAVLGANRILTKALGLRRAPREWFATGLFFLVIIVMAWVLRRLQARKLI
jgi:hypothetical protein